MNKKAKIETIYNKNNNSWQLEITYFETAGGADYEDTETFPEKFTSKEQAYVAAKEQLKIRGFDKDSIEYE